jgi:deoxyribonuclease-4
VKKSKARTRAATIVVHRGPPWRTTAMAYNKDMRAGFHVGIGGGVPRAVERAVQRGCDTMQIFVSNPRGWKLSRIPPGDAAEFRDRCREEDIAPVFVHTPYLINLAAPSPELWGLSLDMLVKNMQTAAALGSSAVVTHLGSHGGAGEDEGIERIVLALHTASARCGEDVHVLLETTAGSGRSVGHSFFQLGRIVRALQRAERPGICLDTCHVFAAGYELRTPQGLQDTLDELQRELGLEYLELIHANDSKGGLGSRLDRHEHIGDGELGMEAFAFMAGHPALRDLPWILETPGTSADKDRENLRLLRSLAAGT